MTTRPTDDAFRLFAAYHLGLSDEGEYHFANLHEVADRLGMAPAELLEALAREKLDPESVMASGFNLSSAQVDVELAESNAERLAIARRHFDALRATHGHRDWERELAEDAAENERVFGHKGPVT